VVPEGGGLQAVQAVPGAVPCHDANTGPPTSKAANQWALEQIPSPGDPASPGNCLVQPGPLNAVLAPPTILTLPDFTPPFHLE
jgi:hypothetical protein